MPFVKIEKRIGVNDSKPGASMSMRTYKGSPRPITFVSLRRAYLGSSGFNGSLLFDVEIGEGDDAGKLRIVPNHKGAFAARMLKAGTLMLDIGYVPQFGEDAHPNHGAHVETIDGAAIVTVPEWTDGEADEDEDDEDIEVEQRQPAKPAKPAAPSTGSITPPNPIAARKPAKAPVSAAPVEPPAQTAAKRTHNGVTIDTTLGKEAISYKGETLKVSHRGARLIEALARAMPNCIDEARLIALAWEGRPPQNASVALDMICADLKALKKLGLDVRAQRGIGRQLVEIA